MSDQKRPAFAQVMTPEGIFQYPVLNTPDTKFDADGVYKVPLRLGVDESQSLIEKIDAAFEANLAAVKADLQAKLKDAKTGAEKGKLKKELDDLKASDRPYKAAYDDEGNETGEHIFTFKMPAQYTAKKGAKAGQVVKMKPDIFDATGKAMKGNIPAIWGGTTGIVAGELRPFYTAKVGAGISLRLKAVQIIKLVSQGSGRDAGAYGFGQVEGGYAAQDSEEPEGPFADQSGGDETQDDGNKDF